MDDLRERALYLSEVLGFHKTNVTAHRLIEEGLRAAVEAERAELLPLLRECAEDLANLIEIHYSRRGSLSETRRYHRDLEIVAKACEAIRRRTDNGK